MSENQTLATERGPSDAEQPALSVEIVTTGTEILLGEIVDTNAAWIAQQLRESGINLYYKTTVGDNAGRVRSIVELGLSRSDVILVTGGLGPTKDDITRQAIADAVSAPLALHAGALATLSERFARFGAQMTENNVRQAYIPAGAELVENPVGTAPGFIATCEEGAVIAMPGVPREMKRMMRDTILPYLRQRNGNRGIIRRRVLRTIAIGESTIDHLIGHLMERANPTIGLAAHLGQADVRITARAVTEAEVEAMLDAAEAEVRDDIGPYVYSATPKEPFEAVVARLMLEKAVTIALFETNTGGQIAHRLTAASPESNPVAGTWTPATVADAPAPLRASAERVALERNEALAIEMASALRSSSGSTYGMAVLGTTGEDEGVWGQQQGETFIALVGPEGGSAQRIGYGGIERTTIIRLGNSALALLWRALGGGQA